jgi:hypothetical protein
MKGGKGLDKSIQIITVTSVADIDIPGHSLGAMSNGGKTTNQDKLNSGCVKDM